MVAVLAALLLVACAGQPPVMSEGRVAEAAAQATSADAARASERPLPAGPGRAILVQGCTGCHDLNGLWAYQGYWDESRWREMIATMIGHGAELGSDEIEVLAAYLVEHFGPGTR